MTDDSFRDFVLDQLNAVSEVRARAMFGARGLYSGETFFGILDAGRLFFKTNFASQSDYLSCGMEAFTYEARGKTIALGFHEVPPDVLENAAELTLWAQKAIRVAISSKKTKKRKN